MFISNIQQLRNMAIHKKQNFKKCVFKSEIKIKGKEGCKPTKTPLPHPLCVRERVLSKRCRIYFADIVNLFRLTQSLLISSYWAGVWCEALFLGRFKDRLGLWQSLLLLCRPLLYVQHGWRLDDLYIIHNITDVHICVECQTRAWAVAVSSPPLPPSAVCSAWLMTRWSVHNTQYHWRTYMCRVSNMGLGCGSLFSSSAAFCCMFSMADDSMICT